MWQELCLKKTSSLPMNGNPLGAMNSLLTDIHRNFRTGTHSRNCRDLFEEEFNSVTKWMERSHLLQS